MKRLFLMLLFLLFSLSSWSQNLSMKVGDVEYLSLPDVPMDGYITHAWWSCNKPEISFLEQDEVGAIIQVTSYFSGTATVSCTYAYSYYGVDNNIHVNHGDAYFFVTCVQTANASISDSYIELDPGESYQLDYWLDVSVSNTPSAVWSSSDETIAVVDQSGKVTAKKTGAAKISCDPIIATPVYCDVIVRSIAPMSISLSPTYFEITEGDKQTLTVSYVPSSASSSLSWRSSDESVATVSSSGRVAGVKAGSAQITATTANGCSASASVQVLPAPTAVFLPESVELGLGFGQQLIPEVTPSYAVATFSWSTSNRNVVTVSDSGMITGVAVGSASVTVKTQNGKTAICSVVIVDGGGAPSRASITNQLNRINSLISKTNELY